MNAYGIMLAGERLTALPSGALWVEALQTLAVADLHLGKAERRARLVQSQTRDAGKARGTDRDGCCGGRVDLDLPLVGFQAGSIRLAAGKAQ